MFLTTPIYRPDVSQALGKPRKDKTSFGFDVDIHLSDSDAEESHLSIIGVDLDDKTYYEIIVENVQ